MSITRDNNLSFDLDDDTEHESRKPLRRLRKRPNLGTLPQSTSASENDEIVLSENSESPKPRRRLKRIRTIDRTTHNDEQLVLDDLDDEESNTPQPNENETDADESNLGEDDLDADQRRQLNNNDWLMRVINHLLPLSKPISNDLTDRQKFLALKKQWGYTGSYEVVDAKHTDCTLCSHEHVASLFTIMNIYNNNITKAGSTCIKQFRALNGNTLFFSADESRKRIQRDIDFANAESLAQRNLVRKYVQ